MDESHFDPYKVPDAFIKTGAKQMEDKYLVIRRDGTVAPANILAGAADSHEFGPDDSSIVQVMRDCVGGKIFIASAWDAEQYQREAKKEEAGE